MATAAGPPTREQYEIAHAPPHDEPEIVDAVEEEHPTESHALANADHDEKGAAQHDHEEAEVRNLGWNEKSSKIPDLVGGLTNEELWTLIRRFNKVRFQHTVYGNTDTHNSKCIMSKH
jgi:hypothetical protein